MRNLIKSLIFMVIFSLSASAAYAAGAVLEAVGGADTVSVKRAGKVLQLKKGDALEAGDEVETSRSSAADIRLEDKTLIRVGVNSAYKYEQDSKSVFHRLLSGIVRVLVPPKADAKAGAVRFRMDTPEGTIGVRGTEFVVIRQKAGETKLKGLEGTVMFGAEGTSFTDTDKFVMVKRGYESSINKGQKPTAAKEFPLPAYLKELDTPSGGFVALAERKGGVVKARAKETAAATTAAIGKAAAPVVAKTKAAVGKAQEKETKEEDVDLKLFLAAGKGSIPEAKDALKKGAKINLAHEEGNTALHAAAVEAQLDMIKFLLKEGANVNAKNSAGYTPLMVVALESGDARAALILIDEGKADEDIKDAQGQNALAIAAEKWKTNKEQWQDLVTILQEKKK